MPSARSKGFVGCSAPALPDGCRGCGRGIRRRAIALELGRLSVAIPAQVSGHPLGGPLGKVRDGMSEQEVRATGRAALIATMPMTRVGRARERGETTGFMQVLVDTESQRILGATLFGIEADEVVHCLLDVMSGGLPYTSIMRTVHIHPTVAELLPTLLGSLQPLA